MPGHDVLTRWLWCLICSVKTTEGMKSEKDNVKDRLIYRGGMAVSPSLGFLVRTTEEREDPNQIVVY